MVNNLGELNMVERTMNDYIGNFKELICGKTTSDGKIDSFIKKVMRKEYWVENGKRPSGADLGELGTRVHDFLVEDMQGDKSLTDPRYSSKSIDDGTTFLQRKEINPNVTLNNNPNFRANMIEVLNTPFDHIERIVLDDFSSTMFDHGNYFKELFTFPSDSDKKYNGGFSGFTMRESTMPEIFDVVNNKFRPSSNGDAGNGGFFIDSFTYTPFVDYSQVGEGGYDRIGVYSDTFLNDYNTGKYDVQDNQVDKNRNKHMSSNLYTLMNLKKDLEDAKVAFRNVISLDDGLNKQVYIYTLCEHLASLFAKLSNVRMSHEIYGFKHPHAQWEGILALDVWYNLLYREIDAKYPFDEKCLNLNPMQRRKFSVNGSQKYVVMDDGKNLNLLPGGTCRWEGSSNDAEGLGWMSDEISEDYIYIWDANLWGEYYDNSEKIAKTRKECTTPRGVLAKIQKVVKDLEYKWQYYAGLVKIGDSENYYNRDSDSDYEWFKQPGKVYAQHDSDFGEYSQFTKYVNLHLGRAYDVMSGKEYCELVDSIEEGQKTYLKPTFSDVENKRVVLDKMVQSGFRALVDAFSVVQNEHLFNVYNSNSNQVEEFDSANAKFYSQSQCAIAIERVFSRIYKYLQFKSTTSETFQRHINIDSGYKYLTTESLKNSDHVLDIYYDLKQDEDDHIEKHYLRYLAKLNYYLGNTAPDIGLTDDERAILGQFCEILSLKTLDWLDKKWDLCPILKRVSDNPEELYPRKSMARSAMRSGPSDEDFETSDEYVLYIDFTKNGYMDSGWIARTGIEVPSDWNPGWETDDRLRVTLDSVDGFDLSKVKFKNGVVPTYTYHYTDGTGSNASMKSNYDIAGYTLSSGSSNLRFTKNQTVNTVDFGGQTSLTIYVAWSPEYIISFESDKTHYEEGESAGYMSPVKLSSLGGVAPICTFNHPRGSRKTFTYYNDTQSARWQDTSAYTSQTVFLYSLIHWRFSIGLQSYSLKEGDPLRVTAFNLDAPPVIVMTAYWKRAYDVITF